MKKVKQLIKKLNKAVSNGVLRSYSQSLDDSVGTIQIRVADAPSDKKALQFIAGLFPGAPTAKITAIPLLGGHVSVRYDDSEVLLRVKCQKKSDDFKYVAESAAA